MSVCNRNEKRGHEFEREHGGVDTRVCREEREVENNVIIYNHKKYY